QVGFTTVRAPFSGHVSERLVDVGNSVVADQTVLARIVSVDPIHFAFEGSEALLLKYQRQGLAGPGAEVRVRLQDETAYVHPGRVDYMDPMVDPRGGHGSRPSGAAERRRVPEAGHGGTSPACRFGQLPCTARPRRGDRHRCLAA